MKITALQQPLAEKKLQKLYGLQIDQFLFVTPKTRLREITDNLTDVNGRFDDFLLSVSGRSNQSEGSLYATTLVIGQTPKPRKKLLFHSQNCVLV